MGPCRPAKNLPESTRAKQWRFRPTKLRNLLGTEAKISLADDSKEKCQRIQIPRAISWTQESLHRKAREKLRSTRSTFSQLPMIRWKDREEVQVRTSQALSCLRIKGGARTGQPAPGYNLVLKHPRASFPVNVNSPPTSQSSVVWPQSRLQIWKTAGFSSSRISSLMTLLSRKWSSPSGIG